MNTLKHYPALIIFCYLAALNSFIQSNVSAQISSPQSDFHVATEYQINDVSDTIYIFNMMHGNPGSNIGSLTAIAPAGYDSSSFLWEQFNTATLEFDILVQEHTNVSRSQIAQLGEGGYRVTISKAALDDVIYHAWVFPNHLQVEVLKNADGKVPFNRYTCSYVDLNGTVIPDTFNYYHPVTKSGYILTNNINEDLDIRWSYSNEQDQSDHAFSRLNWRNNSPPYFDTDYQLNVVDKFGAIANDEVLYESIQTKADFSFRINDLYTGEIRPFEDNGESAPARVEFTNKSINGSRYHWFFTDTAVVFNRQDPEDILVSDTTSQFYTYYLPRMYTVRLIATSEQGCVDSITNHELNQPLIILQSKLEVPNVFTPDAATNRVFIISREDNLEQFASIFTFHITIYNRWGKKMHEYNGDINEWEGWNGGVNDNLNQPAAPGVYYYVIEARGFDNVRYRRGIYRGFLYLFRNR